VNLVISYVPVNSLELNMVVDSGTYCVGKKGEWPESQIKN
jgi:hypothetical protein